ncbi:signal peptidase II [Streptomonospora litoralis]|uniref:Lipoprotein signal peptidase n=1 Tax=Streptomonospora litoralis TaxID=2498135 RepID=A0A4P6Q0A7_9ACTN|nr:signal peptidase II [Streptomonospora litoralis]QBI53905.1 Lipoprotein signal peptidase [Streptomonospora litoralis]
MNGPAARSPRRFLLLTAVAAAALAADYATKELALAAFEPGESMRVVGELLRFTLVFNTGAAFSMGQGVPWLFFIIAVGVVVYILFMARKLGSASWTVALGLILGGALGNLVDRAFRPPAPLHGAVVDWIQVPNFPVFNIADSCICVGGAFAVLLAFRGINLDGTRESDNRAEEAPADEDGAAAQAKGAERPADEAGGGPQTAADPKEGTGRGEGAVAPDSGAEPDGTDRAGTRRDEGGRSA